MSKKRPKYVQEIVDKANERLRTFKVKDESNALFVFVCSYLVQRDMYEGFSFMKLEYNASLNKNVEVFAGSLDKEKFDYLKIF